MRGIGKSLTESVYNSFTENYNEVPKYTMDDFEIIKENTKYDSTGYILKNKKTGKIYYAAGPTFNGYCYKDWDAFENKDGICYIGEYPFLDEEYDDYGRIKISPNDGYGDFIYAIPEEEAKKDGETYQDFYDVCSHWWDDILKPGEKISEDLIEYAMKSCLQFLTWEGGGCSTAMEQQDWDDECSYVPGYDEETTKFEDFIIKESVQQDDIEVVGFNNQFNTTVKQARIDHKNKTFKQGSFKIINDKKLTRKAFYNLLDELKEKGYKELNESEDVYISDEEVEEHLKKNEKYIDTILKLQDELDNVRPDNPDISDDFDAVYYDINEYVDNDWYADGPEGLVPWSEQEFIEYIDYLKDLVKNAKKYHDEELNERHEYNGSEQQYFCYDCGHAFDEDELTGVDDEGNDVCPACGGTNIADTGKLDEEVTIENPGAEKEKEEEKSEVEKDFDEYLKQNNKSTATEDDVNDFFTDRFYDLEDENDLDKINNDEELIRKKYLNEGAGAGYTIKGKIGEANVVGYKVVDTTTDSYGYPAYTLNCNIDVTLEDLSFESYYYGGNIDFPVDAKITKLVIVDNGLNTNDVGPDLTENAIKETLEEASFDCMLGAGWVHSTFTGTLEGTFDNEGYSEFYVDDFVMTLNNETIVKFIDEKVSGDADEMTYAVFDDTDDWIDSFSDKDEAIEYAKANNCKSVVEEYHNVKLIDAEGSIDDDQELGNVVWSRDGELNESTDEDLAKLKKELTSRAYELVNDGDLKANLSDEDINKIANQIKQEGFFISNDIFTDDNDEYEWEQINNYLDNKIRNYVKDITDNYLNEPSETKQTIYYFIVGVCLDENRPDADEKDFYNMPDFGIPYKLMDENLGVTQDKEEAMSYVTNYINEGVKGTFGAVIKSTVPDFIDLGKEPIYAGFADWVEPGDIYHFKSNGGDLIYCAYSTKDGIKTITDKTSSLTESEKIKLTKFDWNDGLEDFIYYTDDEGDIYAKNIKSGRLYFCTGDGDPETEIEDDTKYQLNESESIKPKIVKGKTLEEYRDKFGFDYDEGDLWDIDPADLKDGSLEVDPDKEYWEIDGRYFEAYPEDTHTDIEVSFEEFPDIVAKGASPEARKNLFFRCYAANAKPSEYDKFTLEDVVNYIKETEEPEYYKEDLPTIIKCCELCGLSKEEAEKLCKEGINESRNSWSNIKGYRLTESEKHYSPDQALSYLITALNGDMGSVYDLCDYAEELADKYNIEYNDLYSECSEVISKGLEEMYNKDPEEFKDTLKGLLAGIDVEMVKDILADCPEIIPSLKTLRPYSHKKIDELINSLSEVNVDNLKLAYEFQKYLYDTHEPWKVLGNVTGPRVYRDIIDGGSEYDCVGIDNFNFVDLPKSLLRNIGYGWKTEGNNVVADLIGVGEEYKDHGVRYLQPEKYGPSFTVTTENKEEIFKQMADELIKKAKELKKKNGLKESAKLKNEQRVIMQQGNVTCLKDDNKYHVFENKDDNENVYNNEDEAMRDLLNRVGVDPDREIQEK